MKIVIAPDSYKECLTALQVAISIESGFREVFPDAVYIKVPVADGGEGTVDAMIEATSGRRVVTTVRGPLGDPVEAFYGLTGDGSTAVIEMAAASGLALVPPAMRNPLNTTSFGTGQLIRSALDAGARKFILGIGGSATNEGGAGMLQALGVRLLDVDGQEIAPTGMGLGRLARIDMSAFDPRLASLGNLILAGGYLHHKRNFGPVLAFFSRLLQVRGLACAAGNLHQRVLGLLQRSQHGALVSCQVASLGRVGRSDARAHAADIEKRSIHAQREQPHLAVALE